VYINVTNLNKIKPRIIYVLHFVEINLKKAQMFYNIQDNVVDIKLPALRIPSAISKNKKLFCVIFQYTFYNHVENS